jgi:hypothetical protein
MKRCTSILVLAVFMLAGCAEENPLAVEGRSGVLESDAVAEAQAGPSDKACWGQATKVFVQMGAMGEHSSEQANPRLGLRNLARALYNDGVLPDDTMQSLGAFVASALGLEIDACM